MGENWKSKIIKQTMALQNLQMNVNHIINTNRLYFSIIIVYIILLFLHDLFVSITTGNVTYVKIIFIILYLSALRNVKLLIIQFTNDVTMYEVRVTTLHCERLSTSILQPRVSPPHSLIDAISGCSTSHDSSSSILLSTNRMSHIIIHNIHEGDGEVYKIRRGGHVWVCVVFGSVKIRHHHRVYIIRVWLAPKYTTKCSWTIWVDYFWTFDFHALHLLRVFIIVSFPIYRFNTKYASDYTLLSFSFSSSHLFCTKPTTITTTTTFLILYISVSQTNVWDFPRTATPVVIVWATTWTCL